MLASARWDELFDRFERLNQRLTPTGNGIHRYRYLLDIGGGDGHTDAGILRFFMDARRSHSHSARGRREPFRELPQIGFLRFYFASDQSRTALLLHLKLRFLLGQRPFAETSRFLIYARAASLAMPFCNRPADRSDYVAPPQIGPIRRKVAIVGLCCKSHHSSHWFRKVFVHQPFEAGDQKQCPARRCDGEQVSQREDQLHDRQQPAGTLAQIGQQLRTLTVNIGNPVLQVARAEWRNPVAIRRHK